MPVISQVGYLEQLYYSTDGRSRMILSMLYTHNPDSDEFSPFIIVIIILEGN